MIHTKFQEVRGVNVLNLFLQKWQNAKQNLPTDYYQGGTADIDGTQVGRINKIIVEAVESQILLYNASPLFNGNTVLAEFQKL